MVRNLGVLSYNSLSRQHIFNTFTYQHVLNLDEIALFVKTERCSLLLLQKLLCFHWNSVDLTLVTRFSLVCHYVKKLQKVPNTASRIIFSTPRRDHVTPVLHRLHWLPVHIRKQHRISFLSSSSSSGSSPKYSSDLTHVYTPVRNLHSSKTKHALCNLFFDYKNPCTCISPPFELRQKEIIVIFQFVLKTPL